MRPPDDDGQTPTMNGIPASTSITRGDPMYEGDFSLLEEIEEQDFEGVAYGACTTNTFSLSNFLSNQGGFCTATVECQSSCH
jgi:hypothetical protein